SLFFALPVALPSVPAAGAGLPGGHGYALLLRELLPRARLRAPAYQPPRAGALLPRARLRRGHGDAVLGLRLPRAGLQPPRIHPLPAPPHALALARAPGTPPHPTNPHT